MSRQFEASIPSYLEAPPDGNIAPPVETRVQELPFGELTWENFERLCLRLARLERNVEHCQLYGERGENQEGIDLYARKALSEKYTVYQCKREKNFSAAKIEAAVTKFLEGKWVNQTDVFVLCTQESLRKTKRADKFEAQKEVLDKKGISFIAWDSGQLSIKLKAHPEIVDDFFSRAWVVAFCGQEQADSLVGRLNLKAITELYREWLRKAAAHFTVLGFDTPLSIETAWIQLLAYRNYKEREERSKANKTFEAVYIPRLYDRVVLTGRSGTGKSTFLQRIAYSLPNSGNRVLWVRLPRVAEYHKQGKSFAEAILIDAAENSGIEINQLKTILANPNYLLADGLDECNTSQLGVTAQELLNWSEGHSDTKIIVATRPDSHDAGLFSEWEHIELRSLASQDIKKNTRQLLEARFTDESRIEEQLALFEQRLKVNRTASLAAQNPLLLGFLVQLSINDVELAQYRTGLYESIIELSYKQSPPSREFKVELDASVAFRILEITGWILQNSPGIPERKLVELIGKELADELDLKPLAAQREAQKGLEFWKERRIIECQRIGTQDSIAFIHLSLQEYAAGKYAASLTTEEIHEWLTQVRRESRWTEVILFSAGAGAAEQISTCLLQVDGSEEQTSIELLLAAKALAEINEPKLECVGEVVNQLCLRLELPTPDIVFKAAEAILPFTAQAANLIGSTIKPLFESSQPWTRIAATRIAIACGESYEDLSALRKIFDDIVAEIAAGIMDCHVTHLPDSETGVRQIVLEDSELEKKYGKLAQELYEQIMLQGAQILVKQQPTFNLIKQIHQLTETKCFSVPTHIALLGLLEAYLKSLDEEDYQRCIQQVEFLQKPPEAYKPLIKISSEDILCSSEVVERKKHAMQEFLKAVVRATNTSPEIIPGKLHLENLINLGILCTGMGWWRLVNTAWDALSNRHDLDAVDTVFRGAIAAMDLDLQRLALEAAWALEGIKSIPSYQDSLRNSAQELGSLAESYPEIAKAYFNFINQIPKVPADPKWERAREVDLSLKVLVRALKHPSDGIRFNAAQLLNHGAGGDEAANLVQKFLEEGD